MEIKCRYSNRVLCSCETGDTKTVVSKAISEKADLSSANLRYADLSSADLSSADLRSADLRSADLRYANLRYANLRSADLSSANLRYADLSSANLRSADLSYADLSYADLDDVTMNWSSHDLVAGVLLVAAGRSVSRRMVAGFILVSRDLCWSDFLRLRRKRQSWWAMNTLKPLVKDGDNAPDVLRNWAMPVAPSDTSTRLKGDVTP